jgi:hypothetical protein
MILNFLCRLFSGKCEPRRPEQAAPSPATSADLGQKDAKNEAASEEELRHMEGAPPPRLLNIKKLNDRVDSGLFDLRRQQPISIR